MKAIVIAGGFISQPAFYQPLTRDASLILCADSGYENAVKIGIVPDLVIGDFDSFPYEKIPAEIKTRRLPVEKDRTDLHECIVYAKDQGADEILLFGALGSRLDHSLAAISLVYLGLTLGVSIRIINENNELFMFQGTVKIPKKEGYRLSLLPLTPTIGIWATGVYYGLSNGTMDWGNPYGVSNEFTDEVAEITVEKGVMIGILSKD